MRQDVGCGPGWAVLKKRGRPGRGQSSWLRDDPFYDLLLVEEQLQAGLVQPHPRWLELEECQGKGQRCLQRPGVGGRPGSRELGGGGVEGGEQTAKKPGGERAWGWRCQPLVLSASVMLCPGFAGTQCKFIPFSVGRTAHGCSHSHISPQLRLSMLNTPLIPSTVGLLITIISLLAPGKPSRTRCLGLVVLQTWPDSPSAGVRGGSEACDRPGQSDPPNQGSVPGAVELRVERSQLFPGKKAGSIFPSEGLDPWRACRSARGADPARPCCSASLLLRHWPG